MKLLHAVSFVLLCFSLTGCIDSGDDGGGSDSDTSDGGTTVSNPSYVSAKESEGFLCNTTQNICYLLTVTDQSSLTGTYEQCSISTEVCSTTPLNTYIENSQSSYANSVYSISNASLDSCSINSGVYTCIYNDDLLTYNVKSQLSYNSQSYSVTHSYTSKNWTASKEDEGFSCDYSSCVKIDILDSSYNGTIEQCTVSTKSCTAATSIYDYARNLVNEAASSNSPSITIESCKYTTDNYYSCYGLSSDSQKTYYYVDLSPLSADNLSLFANQYSTSVNNQEFLISQHYGQKSIYPVFNIEKPTTWQTDIPELSNILDTSDDWNKDYTWHQYRFEAQRNALCVNSSDNLSIKCVVGVEYDEYYQCEKFFTPADRSCLVSYTEPALVKEILDQQLAFNGFDPAEEENFTYSDNYPVMVSDENCEIDHSLVSGKVLEAKVVFASDRHYDMDLTEQQDRNLLRWSDQTAWAGVEGESHCAGVTALITGNNGAPIKLVVKAVKDLNLLPQFVPNETLLGVSQGNGYLTATTSLNSTNFFAIWAGGNSNQNFTTGISENPSDDFIWGTSLQSQALFVGAVDSDGVAVSGYAVPGSNTNVQSRWIMALGKDVMTATTTAYGKAAVYQTSGTSFAQPFVSRAMAKGKNICPSSTYSSLSSVLLSTAKRDFVDYDPSVYGQGILNVSAFTSSLQAACP